MRTLISAAFLLTSATVAFAQEETDVIAPPATAAPSAAAPIDQRTHWCEQYATWLVAMTETGDPTPADVRQTHRLEVELNSCTIDPQGYERQTRVEAQRAVEIATG